MKILRLFAIVVAMLYIASQGNAMAQEATQNPGFDKAVIEALCDQVWADDDYTADPTFFAKAVVQADALLSYFEQKYGIEKIRKGEIEVAQSLEPFGAEDTELFRNLNFLGSSLYGMEEKMDEATREAYAKYQEHNSAVRGY